MIIIQVLFTKSRMTLSYLPGALGMILNNYCNDKRAVKIQCFLIEGSFGTELNRHSSIFGYKIRTEHKQVHEEVSHYVCTVSDPNKKEVGSFHAIEHKDELYVLSGESADFFEKILLKILRVMYPQIIRAFIHSDGIYETLDNFEKIMSINFKKKKAIEKQLFGLSPRTDISYETRKLGREYPNFKEAFEEARSNDLWIDRIQVFGRTSTTDQLIQFSISRRGEVTIYDGTFDILYSYVLHPIVQRGKERREQFKNRSRKEQPNKETRPLIVRFGKNVFEKIETRKEFARILEKYPLCNYSIVHDGNPHVYLSVLDRMDNSSFSVRTIGDDSLLLIPQIKTSELALMRFSEFLVSSFYEGVIQNYKKNTSTN